MTLKEILLTILVELKTQTALTAQLIDALAEVEEEKEHPRFLDGSTK